MPIKEFVRKSKLFGYPVYPDFSDLGDTEELKKILKILSRKNLPFLSKNEHIVYKMFADLAYDFTLLEHLLILKARKGGFLTYPEIGRTRGDFIVPKPNLVIKGLLTKIKAYLKDTNLVQYRLQLEILKKVLVTEKTSELKKGYKEYKRYVKDPANFKIFPQFILDIESRDINIDLDEHPQSYIFKPGLYLLLSPKSRFGKTLLNVKTPKKLKYLITGDCVARGADGTTQANSAMVIGKGAFFSVEEFLKDNQWYLNCLAKETKRLNISYNKEFFLQISYQMLINHEFGHIIRKPKTNRFGKLLKYEDIYSEFFADSKAVFFIINEINKQKEKVEKLKYFLALCCYYDIDISDLKNESKIRDLDKLDYEYSVSKVLIWRFLIRCWVVRKNYITHNLDYDLRSKTLIDFKYLMLYQRDNPKDLRITRERKNASTLEEDDIMLTLFQEK